MLNISALYPYFLVVLVSSTLGPVTSAASMASSNVTVTKGDTSVNILTQGPSKTLVTIDPSSSTSLAHDEKLIGIGLCILGSGNCNYILGLIKCLQIELNCPTIVALQIRLSTGYDLTCKNAVIKCCGILNINTSIVNILLGIVSLKENTLEVPGDNRTFVNSEVNSDSEVIAKDNRTVVNSEVNSDSEVIAEDNRTVVNSDSEVDSEANSDSEVTRTTSCNCNLLDLINQIVLRININASLQCRYPDLRYCDPSLLDTLCNTCVCATIVIG